MAEITGLRNNALPYPIYGAPWGVVFPMLDADGDLVTGATTPDAEASLNGNTFADCTNESTEIATSSGMYYLLLTAAEMTADVTAVIAKSATAGMKTTAMVLYPRKLVTIRSGTSASAGSATSTIVLDASASAVDDFYNGMVCIATIDTLVEVRVISDYTGSTQTATVVPDWNVAPDSTDTFVIKLPEGVQLNQANVSHWNSLAAVALPLIPTVAGRTLDVSAGGEAGVDWANVGSPTTANALTGTTIATTQKVDVETIKTNPVVNGGTITFPTTATLASTTNITAGTIATATNVTTVNGLAAAVITAASIAADAITAAKIADGAIDAATFAAGAINAAAIAADAITDAKVASDVTIASVTGAVGSVTGAVGSVTGAVGSIATGGIAAASFAAGAIDAAAIAADAIGSSELAASAVTEIRSLASGTSDSGTTTTMVDAARTEADDDYWKGALIVFTSGTIAGQARLITGFTALSDTITFAPATTQAVATQTYEIWPAGRADLGLIAGAAISTSTAQLGVNAVQAGGTAWGSGAITAASIASDAITDAKVASDVTIASVTGAVGSVTGNVGGNVTGSVGSVAAGGIAAASFAAGAIDAAAIAANAIGASELAADAATEIGTAVWATATRVLTASTNLGDLDDAVLAVLGTPSDLGGGATIAANLADIEAQTDDIGAAGAGLTALATQASVNTVDDFLDTEVAAILAAVDTEVAAIKAKTDSLTFTVAGKVDANPTAVNGDATAAANLAKTTRAIGRGTVDAGASTTSLPTSAFAPSAAAADQFKGRIVTFDADTTTAALRGQATDITASSTAAAPTLTVTALTSTPASGDTFSVT